MITITDQKYTLSIPRPTATTITTLITLHGNLMMLNANKSIPAIAKEQTLDFIGYQTKKATPTKVSLIAYEGLIEKLIKKLKGAKNV